MKKFTNQKPELPKTEMKDKIINFEAVEKMRVAVYDKNDKGEHCFEVDFHFDSPQSEWDNSTSLKLRNNLYKINNIAYKMPSGFEDLSQFYEVAIERARELTRYTKSNLHNKLGKRYQDRYYTIPCTYVSYDPITDTGILQITQPVIDENGEVDVMSNYQCIEFEMDSAGKGLKYTWIC